MNTVNIGNLVQELAMRRTAHFDESNKLGAQIAQLEQQLGALNEKRHRHLGAGQSIEEVIQLLQRQMQEGPTDNPAEDPNAESDD